MSRPPFNLANYPGLDALAQAASNGPTVMLSGDGKFRTLGDQAEIASGDSTKALFGDGSFKVPSGGGGGSINTQTGTSYTLQSSDNGGIVYFTNGSAIALTVPSGLGVAFECGIAQGGAGQVTITGSGATVNNKSSFTKTAGQYALVSLLAVAVDTFILAGDGA